MGITLAEAYKKHPVETNLIVPLDFGAIKDVPESHAWDSDYSGTDTHSNNDFLSKNPKNDHKNDGVVESNSISVINLEDPQVIDKIFNACETWGVFQITNHGISGQVLQKLESEIKRLFDLPMEEKMKVVRSPGGATGYGSPRITPFFSKLMWCEGFTIMGNSLVDHAKQLWPNDYQGFCDVMGEYQAQMMALSDKLMGLMLKSLNIPEPMYWANHDPETRSTALQLNSYPACPDPTKTMGLAQHTDTFLFTILHQSSTASGLQLFKDGPGWVTVEPVPDALVVNVGDLLHIISNGRFPSVVHRAVVNNVKQRISAAYFFGPPLDFHVSPFVGYPGCVGPCFKSMKVMEYVSIKSKLLDSALSSIKLKESDLV